MPLIITDVLINFAAFFLLLQVVLSCCLNIEQSAGCPKCADILHDLTSFCETHWLHLADTVQMAGTQILQIITSDHSFDKSNETLILFAQINILI